MVWFTYSKTKKSLPMNEILATKLESLGLGSFPKKVKEVKEVKNKTTKKKD